MRISLSKTLLAIILCSSAGLAGASERDTNAAFVADDLFAHSDSLVLEQGTLSSPGYLDYAYRQLRGLLPEEWEMVFTENRIALLMMEWSAGERWVDVLNRWGRTNNVGIMIDGQSKRIVASREMPRRRAGIVFVNSGNALHQEMYEPDKRFIEAEAHIRRRLNALTGTYADEVELLRAQARLFELEEQMESHIAESVAEVNEEPKPVNMGVARTAVVEAEEDEPEVFTPIEPNYHMVGDMQVFQNGRVTYPMKEGFLKPQLIKMLMDSGRVSREQDVIWLVSENHQWPNDYLAQAQSFDHLVGGILQTYDMTIVYQGNDIAVIRYQGRG